MLKHYFYSLLIVSLFSCTKINYVGNSYDPTNNIEVFVDEGAIKRKYDIVGKGYLSTAMSAVNPERIQTTAVAKAKQKGADAVLSKDYVIPVTSIDRRLQTDSVNKGVVLIGSTTMRQNSSPEFVVLFLKYVE